MMAEISHGPSYGISAEIFHRLFFLSFYVYVCLCECHLWRPEEGVRFPELGLQEVVRFPT